MRELIVGLLLLASAAYLFWKDRRVRSGRDRGWVSNYRNMKIPVWLRNGPLVARYTAAAMLGWGLAALLYLAAELTIVAKPLAALGVIGLVVLGTMAGVYALVGTYRVPDALKPPWLRDEEVASGWRPSEGRVDGAADLVVLAIPLGFLAIALVSGVLLLLMTIFR